MDRAEITTGSDARGSEVMRTTLPSGTPVEVARPDTDPSMGLVVAPDIGGLRPLFDDMVARLADEHGWAVAAVEPFPGRDLPTLEARMAEVSSLRDADVVADLVAAADLLDVEPVGVLGFCMGGMWTMKAAASLRFCAAVPFYGMIRNPANWRSEHNADAIDVLRATPGAAELVLAVVGTADPYTPPGDVADLEALGATVVRYDGAEHGFVHDPDRPAHRPGDAADAWQRAVDWLRSHAASRS
jgi:carboxymethylenebutenolidase